MKNVGCKGGKMQPLWTSPCRITDMDSHQRVGLQCCKTENTLKIHYINRYASHSCQPLHQLLCQPLLPATASIAMPPTPASHSINCYASHSCQPLHQLLCQPLLPATRPLTTTATRRNICANQRSRKVDIADDIFVSEMSSLCQRCHLNHEGWMFQ